MPTPNVTFQKYADVYTFTIAINTKTKIFFDMSIDDTEPIKSEYIMQLNLFRAGQIDRVLIYEGLELVRMSTKCTLIHASEFVSQRMNISTWQASYIIEDLVDRLHELSPDRPSR